MRRHESDETQPELNLAPIMNMVVILIPLLLLSVVFISAAVINVSTPQLTPGPASETSNEPSAHLTLVLSSAGLVVTSKQGELARVEVEDRQRFEESLRALQEARAAGDREAEEDALARLSEQYRWATLYGEMTAVKKKYPETTTLHLTADSELPYALVVRAMDAVRFQLPTESYSSNHDFWAANIAANRSGRSTPLFSDPVLAIAR